MASSCADKTTRAATTATPAAAPPAKQATTPPTRPSETAVQSDRMETPIGRINPAVLEEAREAKASPGPGELGDEQEREAVEISREDVRYPKVAITPRREQPATSTNGMASTNSTSTSSTTSAGNRPGQVTNSGTKPTSMTTPNANATPVFVLGTLPTRGPAEQYSFALLSDGRVRYVGERNTKKAGTFYAQPSPGKVAALQQAFNDFMQTRPISVYPPEEKYSADMPGKLLTYPAADGTEGQITIFYNAPDEYTVLAEQVERLIEQERWGK